MGQGEIGWDFAEEVVDALIGNMDTEDTRFEMKEQVADFFRKELLRMENLPVYTSKPTTESIEERLSTYTMDTRGIATGLKWLLKYENADDNMMWMFAEMLRIFVYKNKQYRTETDPLANFERPSSVGDERLSPALYAKVLVSKQEELLDRRLWDTHAHVDENHKLMHNLDMGPDGEIVELLRDKMVYCAIIYALLKRREVKF